MNEWMKGFYVCELINTFVDGLVRDMDGVISENTIHAERCLYLRPV